MTRASPSRIAQRAERRAPVAAFAVEPEFAMPPEGMLAEAEDLSDPFELVLGLVHPEGSPIMVAVWDGKWMRRLLPEVAGQWADEIALTPGLGPVVTAIRKLVKRAADIAVASMMTVGNA